MIKTKEFEETRRFYLDRCRDYVQRTSDLPWYNGNFYSSYENEDLIILRDPQWELGQLKHITRSNLELREDAWKEFLKEKEAEWKIGYLERKVLALTSRIEKLEATNGSK